MHTFEVKSIIKRVTGYVFISETNGTLETWHISTSLLCSYLPLSKANYVRGLDSHNASLKKLPSTLVELLHLRYLDLSGNTRISMIPISIVDFYNLQTLKLCDSRSLKELPGTSLNN